MGAASAKFTLYAALAVCIVAMSACSVPRPMTGERAVNVVPADSPYNHYEARVLLGQAQIDERSGNAAQAQAAYRDAALKWPGMTQAWRGLARTADQTGQSDETDAARFMAARTSLTEPNDILTQREIASALRTYLDDQRQKADANPMTLEYGTQLASFYDDLYRVRGTYEQPKPFGNIQPHEVPTAIITGLITTYYVTTVLTQSAN